MVVETDPENGQKAVGSQMVDYKQSKPPLVAEKRHFPNKPAKKSAWAGFKWPKLSAPKFSKARKRKQQAPKRNPVVAVLAYIGKLIWWTFSRFAVAFALVFGIATIYYAAGLPPAKVLMDDRKKGSVTLLDQSGEVFAWRGDQFGGLVRPDTVSEHLKNAVVATEDKRFYSHLGLSPRGMAGAIRTNLREGRSPLSGHGGSTITQQVAKTVYFADLPSFERKIKEVPMSLAMELKYTKDEILAIYLNRAYLGAGTYGFEAASKRYFGKSAREVNPPEAAMLAGLLKAPSRYAPTRNLDASQKRARLILGLMEDQGYLSNVEATLAKENPAQLSEVAEAKAGGYFADWVMEAAPEFIIKETTEDIVIKTTFDARLQKAAEDALAHIFETKVKKGSKAQAAIVVLSRDGAVRAMVGGRKTGLAGGFNRATQALRQTGSSFKPFVYAAALESGYGFDTIVEDSPITLKVPGGEWTPKNYTREYRGEIPLARALSESVNTVAVKISEDIGRARVRAVALDFGIDNEIPDVPSLALGSAESTLLEMTGAYAGLLNGGVKAEPYGLTALTIQGDKEPLLGKTGGVGRRVINAKAAADLTYMMHQVIETGTGKRAKLADREAAGKTGTTQGARDAWFIGFTADYVAGVWMGYDDNRKLSNVTGGGLPADIWQETMLRVHDGIVPRPLEMTRPQPAPEETGTGEELQRTAQKDPLNLKEIGDQFEKDLKELESEAKNILNSVINGIFGKKN